MQPQTRQQMIQKIHIGKSELGMDKNAYVAFLLNTVDKHSCSVMSDAELMIVLRAMQAKGFVVKSKKHGKRPTASLYNPSRQQLMNKIEAFLAEGKKPWNYVHAICKRSFGIDRLQWCTDEQLHKVVQMLAVMARRHGKRT
ncbi:gp16 family protein [Ursidibacter arcticus]